MSASQELGERLQATGGHAWDSTVALLRPGSSRHAAAPALLVSLASGGGGEGLGLGFPERVPSTHGTSQHELIRSQAAAASCHTERIPGPRL